MRAPDELRALVEEALREHELHPDLNGLAEAVRYPLEAGGKRIRPVLCLAVAEAAGGEAAGALPAAVALELIHTFSLVHDDLPALDDDDERRGQPTAHVRFGEGVALLAGDALLAEAFRLAPTAEIGRELAEATLRMIGGQYLDVAGGAGDLASLHALKTGALFEASVGCGLWSAGVPRAEQEPWRRFGAELGLLFQVVDDLLDGDGYVQERGEEGARALADETARRAEEALAALPAETSVLAELLAQLAARTA